MTVVTGLVTHVDLGDDVADARQMSVSARLEAVLADGRSLVLLDGRGWGWSSSASADPGDRITASDIEEDARTVVGPDEPVDGETHERMAAAHWRHLAGVLGRQGVDVGDQELERLPHDVVLGERLRARLRGRL
ncbi:hypothetical protein [Streptomyces lancefieldiae]|uniref:Uncharacterized protein n=1 Tax=Streptomyces lancefieldiae TaxID=3075520 RepID=A0ABU3AS73_9ACTN|nr:hypothetical protein [Streptomyces sp. DSM 40712]MDT0613043.1 hypothetical protein [Streptomyces sp. DSM 40712]